METTAPTPHVRRPPDHPPTNPPCPPHCRAPRAGAHTHAHYVSKSGIQHGAGAHRCVNRRPHHWHHPPYPDVVHGDHGLSCACVFANAEDRAHRPQWSRSAASGTYCVSCVISCVAVCREGGANAPVPSLALTMTYLQGRVHGRSMQCLVHGASVFRAGTPHVPSVLSRAGGARGTATSCSLSPSLHADLAWHAPGQRYVCCGPQHSLKSSPSHLNLMHPPPPRSHLPLALARAQPCPGTAPV